MTKIMYVLAFAILFISAVAFLYKFRKPVDDDINKLTTIRVGKKIVDIGTKLKNEKVRASYVFVNTGKEKLFIKNVTANCHCTVPEFPKKSIEPNDSVTIDLVYDSSSLGYFQTSAIVETNTKEANTLLVIRGEIKENH